MDAYLGSTTRRRSCIVLVGSSSSPANSTFNPVSSRKKSFCSSSFTTNLKHKAMYRGHIVTIKFSNLNNKNLYDTVFVFDGFDAVSLAFLPDTGGQLTYVLGCHNGTNFANIFSEILKFLKFP